MSKVLLQASAKGKKNLNHPQNPKPRTRTKDNFNSYTIIILKLF
jgi:hypothetical protein